MCATAEKVVPRSIPIALRSLISGKSDYRLLPRAELPVQFPCRATRGNVVPVLTARICQSGRYFIQARCALGLKKIDNSAPRSVEPFRDNLFGSNHLPTPAKSSLHPHHDAPILFRKIRRLITDHAMNRAVHTLQRFDFFDVETMENLHERMNGVLQVITPLRDSITLALHRGSQLLGEPAKVIKKK